MHHRAGSCLQRWDQCTTVFVRMSANSSLHACQRTFDFGGKCFGLQAPLTAFSISCLLFWLLSESLLTDLHHRQRPRVVMRRNDFVRAEQCFLCLGLSVLHLCILCPVPRLCYSLCFFTTGTTCVSGARFDLCQSAVLCIVTSLPGGPLYHQARIRLHLQCHTFYALRTGQV